MTDAAYEEAEVATGLARVLLRRLGKSDAEIESRVAGIREELVQ
jgi:hypothetical protein